MEEDAWRKREYVQEIRKSFDTEAGNGGHNETYLSETSEDPKPGWIFLKIRLLAAATLFLGFLFLQHGQMTLYGYAAEDIRQMIGTQDFDYTALSVEFEKLFAGR